MLEAGPVGPVGPAGTTPVTFATPARITSASASGTVLRSCRSRRRLLNQIDEALLPHRVEAEVLVVLEEHTASAAGAQAQLTSFSFSLASR